jgi:hypothetical protein
VDGYAINMREEVATATKVKWWVWDGVVIVAVIVLGRPIRRLQARYGIESLEMTERTHNKRAIQAMINKIEKMMTKIVDASGVKTRGASVVYILSFES